MRSVPDSALCTVCHSSPRLIIGVKKRRKSKTKAVKAPREIALPAMVLRAPDQINRATTTAATMAMSGV
jgi:hypothetical protein